MASLSSDVIMVEPQPSHDLTRTTLAVLFLGGLIATSFWILRPFLAPTIWAVLVVVATWPLMCKLQAMLWGKRALAATAMTAVLVLVFLVPFGYATSVLVANAAAIVAWVTAVIENPPLPPNWVAGLPLIGEDIAGFWKQVVKPGPEGVPAQVKPYLVNSVLWFVAQIGGAGSMLLHYLLTVAVAALLYWRGEKAGDGVRRFAVRLAGARGEQATTLAAQAIRGVAFGVVVTALVQAVLGGVGLALADVPAAGVLMALMFLTSVAQIGAAPVLILAALWTFWQGDTGWGIFLVVWAVIVGGADNVIRPILIKKGVDLPLLLVFVGVIGGLIAFGVVGLFAGPVVLAVSHRLLSAWVSEEGAMGACPETTVT